MADEGGAGHLSAQQLNPCGRNPSLEKTVSRIEKNRQGQHKPIIGLQ